MNIVTMPENIPSAVLIRAIEPIDGIEIMKKNRGINKVENLTNGPGKFTMAMQIDKKLNDLPVYKGELTIHEYNYPAFKIVSRPRIGINIGKDELLRFYIQGNKFVSKL